MKNLISSFFSHKDALKKGLLLACIGLTSACANNDGIVKMPSENQNGRVRLVVIHHTAINFERSAKALTKRSSRPVSSHYLIPEPNDKSYTDDELKIFELVPETKRAWHAGVSYWSGKSGLNDQSIGIELVNESHCYKPIAAPTELSEDERHQNLCFYPDFAESQIELLIGLLQDIYVRHPDINPTHIVGHSDIAPGRKVDPGPRFPWQRLYQLGIGAWYDDHTVESYWDTFSQSPLPIINIQNALSTYGYKIDVTGELDQQTRDVLRAFQLHFSPSLVTSEPTLESTAILFALIEKYHPRDLEELLFVEPVSEEGVDSEISDSASEAAQ